MKFAFISAVNFPKFSAFGDYSFVLAHHVLKNNKYTQYYKTSGKYIIIDNSAAELGESIKIKDVLKAARKVNANEIWCPDKLYDMEKTLKLTRDFISLLTKEDKKRFALVGIPQGKTFCEWFWCYLNMLAIPEIKIIGISKYSVECFNEFAGTKDFSICRKYCVKWLHERGFAIKPLHLAGANHLLIDEIRFYKKYSLVRSMDSNIAFKLGVNKIKIEECISEPIQRLNHNINSLTLDRFEIIKHNIEKIKEALK